MPTTIGGEWAPRAIAAFWLVNAMGITLVIATLGWLIWTTRRAARWTDLIWYGLAVIAMIAVPRLCLDLDSLEILSAPHISWLSLVGTGGLILTIARRRRPQRKVNLSFLLVALTAPALLTYPLWRAVSQAREAANRTTCKSHLKQIGLALHNYQNASSAFPAAAIGNPAVSWRVLLLPYLEQGPLYATYDQTKSWDSPKNDPLSKGRVWVYECPSETSHRLDTGRFRTDFAMLTGDGAFGGGSGPVTTDDITDGQSNTIAVVEASGLRIIWTEPRDFDVTTAPIGVNMKGTTDLDSPGMLSSYLGIGAHALMADGSVRLIRKSIDPELLKKLTTIDGGETINQEF